ncbi:protein croquemort-like isoform X2 [Copidosoma floridanum]|nr:protein croquemort-like isoform X2 [Copidosoma floridanum]
MRRTKIKIGIFSVTALVCLLLGTSSLIFLESFFQNIIKQELTLSPSSRSYKMWMKTPIPMYLKIRLFNWTNPAEVQKNPTVKPHFNQMGPYVFREVNYKVHQVWNNGNSTITFQQQRIWHFEPDLSNGKLTDYVTTINPIASTIVYMVRNKNALFKTLAIKILERLEKLTVTKTVGQFLFDGYEDPLLDAATQAKLKLIPFDKFGWFYSRNGSENYDGIFNILTGASNMNELGMLQEWKYKQVSPYFPNTCGPIKGTNGDLWPPLPNNNTVSVFSPDVCTSLTLKSNGKSEWLGVTGNMYVSDEDMLDNGTRVDSRQCYCKDVKCQPSGVLNVSSCKFGAPAFVSLPHFYLADESYRENITGMEPNKEDHEFQLVIEPTTGIPVKVRAALQINFLIEPDESSSFFKNIPRMYAPMLWFTQETNLTSQYADEMKLLLLLPPLGKWISISVMVIGIICIFYSVFIYVRQRRSDMNENLLPKDRENEEIQPGATDE